MSFELRDRFSAAKTLSGNALQRLTRWATTVQLSDVPLAVQEHAKNQVFSILAAVHSGYSSELGPLIEKAFVRHEAGQSHAIPLRWRISASHAAFLMAAWSMVLDFDDVMLGGHTGHSSVLVSMPYAESGGKTGGELLLAQIVANEIAARINMTVALGQTRGQMATHLHLIGAAAARAKLEGLDQQSFAQAIAFALSYPGVALFPAFLGSDAKTLCASWPIKIGLDSVDAVCNGLHANPDVLEGPRGFIRSLAQFPRMEFLEEIGTNWHTETNSFKIYPGCGYISGIIDATIALVQAHNIRPQEVESVDIFASLFTLGMEAHSQPYLCGSQSLISTLTFSTAYGVASAIIYRALKPQHFSRESVANQSLWEITRRIRLHHDVRITIDSLKGDIPIGLALSRAGRLQAFFFTLGLCNKALSKKPTLAHLAAKLRIATSMAACAAKSDAFRFVNSKKSLGARVEIHTTDRRTLVHAVSIPKGFAGQESWKSARAMMRGKFVDCASVNVGRDAALEAADLLERLEDLQAADIQRVVELNCIDSRRAYGLQSQVTAKSAMLAP